MKKYKQSKAVTNASANLTTALSSKPAAYASQYADKITGLANSITNRPAFSYDFNQDAVYNQYKDNYTRQANMAMQNSMQQASALSGGFGNSYAGTVGNLAFQEQMAQLNNIIPELQQAALSKYQTEGDEMRNNLNMYQTLEDSAKQDYRNQVADYQTDRAYYQDLYNTTADRDYNRYADQRDYSYKEKQDKISNKQWNKQFNRNNYEANRTYNRGVYESDRTYNRGVLESDRNYSLQKSKKKGDVTISDVLKGAKKLGNDKAAIASLVTSSGLSIKSQNRVWKELGYGDEDGVNNEEIFSSLYDIADSLKTGAYDFTDFKKNVPSDTKLASYSNYGEYITELIDAARKKQKSKSKKKK